MSSSPLPKPACQCLLLSLCLCLTSLSYKPFRALSRDPCYFPKIITFLWVWMDMIIPKLTESVAIEVPP